MGNNIPLVTDEGEHFLYVDEVQDGDGRKYSEIPFTPADDLKKVYIPYEKEEWSVSPIEMP